VALDLLTMGETLVEIMRPQVNQPLDQTALFIGPYASGAPFIFAVQAARLGAKVGGIGAVGRDAFGDFLLRQFQHDGIATHGIRQLPDFATGVAFVAYRPDGSRDFVFHIKHAAAGQLAPDLLDEQMFVGLKCLHLMGSTLSIHASALQMGLRAIELAKAHGAKISFDPNLRPQLMPTHEAQAKFAPILAQADVLIPTAEELLLLTQTTDLAQAVSAWLRDGRVLMVTQGAHGCTVYTPDTPQGEHIAPFAVQEVDPTGAGDCFDAGFLVRWLEGATPAESARFANACGALAVTRQGPAEGAMPRADVETFIHTHSS
jgi:sugar/nucleoside kinase (ribokinase family)